MKRTKRRERCCSGCFAFVPAGARKCEFCGYVLKSPGKYVFDKIRYALNIERAHPVSRVKTPDEQNNLFTRREIENLLKLENFKIKMFLILDDIVLLDETALIELGEMLSLMGES